MIDALEAVHGEIGVSLSYEMGLTPELVLEPYTQEGIDQLLLAVQRFGAVPDFDPDLKDQQYACDLETMGAAVDRAGKAGLTLVHGTGDTLQLDLDNGAEINVIVLKKLTEQFGHCIVESWLSKSGRGRHVVLSFPNLNRQFLEGEAIALETALGSDPIRAVFNVVRLTHRVEHPRVLFRPPEPKP